MTQQHADVVDEVHGTSTNTTCSPSLFCLSNKNKWTNKIYSLLLLRTLFTLFSSFARSFRSLAYSDTHTPTLAMAVEESDFFPLPWAIFSFHLLPVTYCFYCWSSYYLLILRIIFFFGFFSFVRLLHYCRADQIWMFWNILYLLSSHSRMYVLTLTMVNRHQRIKCIQVEHRRLYFSGFLRRACVRDASEWVCISKH